MVRNPKTIGRAATSAMDRMKALGRKTGVETRHLYTRYALERWLHRLSCSPHAGAFALKGGMLLPLLGDAHRPTEDIDGNIEPVMTAAQAAEFVREISVMSPEAEDGLEFDVSTLKVEEIRDGRLPGFRLSFSAYLRPERGNPAEIRMKVDLSHGDAITPDAAFATMPSVLGTLAPVELLVYPWATVVAEKLHAIERHGAANSRMKDYYDIVLISRSVELDGQDLAMAVSATFAAWGDVVRPAPVGLGDGFAADRKSSWAGFVGKGRRDLKLDLPDFGEVVAEARAFAAPILEAAAGGEVFESTWIPGAGWKARLGTAPGLR